MGLQQDGHDHVEHDDEGRNAGPQADDDEEGRDNLTNVHAVGNEAGEVELLQRSPMKATPCTIFEIPWNMMRPAVVMRRISLPVSSILIPAPPVFYEKIPGPDVEVKQMPRGRRVYISSCLRFLLSQVAVALRGTF